MSRAIKYLLISMCSVSFVSNADNMSMLYYTSPCMPINKAKVDNSKTDSMIGVILSVTDHFDAKVLENIGAQITFVDGHIVYASIPESMLSAIQECSDIVGLQVPRQAYPTMDLARSGSGVDELHSGVAIGDDIIPYTGKGVVIGVVDGGIDPHHIAFNSEDGTSRVKEYITTTSVYESEISEFAAQHYDTDESISLAPTDFECDGHGTHTASIAAGYGAGLNYGGVAPDADLVLTTMGQHLYDDEIFYGISAAIDYANKVQKPLVVNLSLGSALGPHDGSGVMTSMLEEKLSESGQIICFSAGNDGSDMISFITLSKDFSKDNNPLSTCFAKTYYGTPASSIYMQAWSEDDRSSEICFHVVDTFNSQVVYTSDYISVKTHPEMNSMLNLFDSNDLQLSLLPELDTYFDGRLLIAGNIMQQNNRYMTELLAEFTNIDEYSQYALAFSIKSDDGASVMIETNSSACFMTSYFIDGFVDGNPDNSISDYCTSPYVISVGAWNARSSLVDIHGQQLDLFEGYYGPVNGIASYSSYGKNLSKEGGTLPHVVAPGTHVVAAVTSEYDIYYDALMAEKDGYYWGTKTGTSMSCPFAVGVIALWLEAKPDLSRQQLLDIIKETSVIDDYTKSAGIKTGYGKINAYNGLKYIYNNHLGIEATTTPRELKPIIRSISNRQLEIVLNDNIENGQLIMYDLSGNITCSQSFSGNMTILNHNAVAGVYILSIKTENGQSTNRILVK